MPAEDEAIIFIEDVEEVMMLIISKARRSHQHHHHHPSLHLLLLHYRLTVSDLAEAAARDVGLVLEEVELGISNLLCPDVEWMQWEYKMKNGYSQKRERTAITIEIAMCNEDMVEAGCKNDTEIEQLL